MSTEVVMPQMGESIAEGTITKWMKQVGDHVERDEPLFEISTDKVDAEIPSPAAGILTEIRFKEGDTVEINTIVAVLDGEAGGAAKDAPPTTEDAVAKVEPQEEQAPQAKPSVADVAPQQPQVEASAATGAETQEADGSKAAATRQPTSPAESAKAVGDNGGSELVTADELRRTKSSPLVRKIAQEHGVDIAGNRGHWPQRPGNQERHS